METEELDMLLSQWFAKTFIKLVEVINKSPAKGFFDL